MRTFPTYSVMSYFIQEYQEDLEDEDEDSEVELVVQVWIFMEKKNIFVNSIMSRAEQ